MISAGVRQNRFYPHNFWKISIGVDFQAHYLINKKKVQQKCYSNALKLRLHGSWIYNIKMYLWFSPGTPIPSTKLTTSI
jgi:hypothetical protein